MDDPRKKTTGSGNDKRARGCEWEDPVEEQPLKILAKNASSNWLQLKKQLTSSKSPLPRQTDSTGRRNTDSSQGVKKKRRRVRLIAMDCEMFGVGPGGKEDALGRVSVVDDKLNCLLDAYVLPEEPVTDYRTFVSGLDESILAKYGRPFSEVQAEVAKLIEKKILVGHSLQHDLAVLRLSHPKRRIRDTQKYKPFRRMFSGAIPSLKRLALQVLNLTVQEKSHCSVDDARTAMKLYLKVQKDWETYIRTKRGNTLKPDQAANQVDSLGIPTKAPPPMSNKVKHLRFVARKRARMREAAPGKYSKKRGT